MYRIYCDGELLYDPRDEELAILSGKVRVGLNKTGEFVFSLPPPHPMVGKIGKMISKIEVFEGEESLFEGRVTDSETDMYGCVANTCEGTLAYMLDSIQRPKEYHDLTPESYLQDKITQHNSQVEEEKQFTLGIVEKKTMNYDAREDNQYTDTLNTILDKLVASNGGYLRIRKQKGIRYLDYLESYDRTSLQTIRFGENILDLTEYISVAEIATVLIPLGKSLDEEQGGGRLTIASVNNGKDYIEDKEAITLYGRITRTEVFEDVTVPANLKTKGEEFLKNARNLTATIELTAIDLHLADVDIDRIKLGDIVHTVSKPHGLDKYMLVSKREYDILDPSKDKINLGDSVTALTEKQAALQRQVEGQASKNESVEVIKGGIKELSQKVESTDSYLKKVDEKVQTIELGTGETKTDIDEIKGKLTQFEEDTGVLRESIADIENRLAKVLERLDKLEKPEGGTEMR